MWSKRYGFNFILLHVAIHCDQHSLLKMIIFYQVCIFFYLFVKTQVVIGMKFCSYLQFYSFHQQVCFDAVPGCFSYYNSFKSLTWNQAWIYFQQCFYWSSLLWLFCYIYLFLCLFNLVCICFHLKLKLVSILLKNCVEFWYELIWIYGFLLVKWPFSEY